VSTVLDGANEAVVFRYRPRTLNAGLALCALTAAAIAVALWRTRSAAA
jgi:hypothetical protein